MNDITETETHEVFSMPTEEEAKNSPDAEFDRPYIPRGSVPAVLQSIEVKDSRKGKPMTVWEFAIATGYAEGRTIKTHIVLEQQYRIHKMVTKLGLQLEDGGGIAFTDPKHQGTKCTLMITNGKPGSNGEPFPEIKNVSFRSDEDTIPF